jgi:hypothetical protein
MKRLAFLLLLAAVTFVQLRGSPKSKSDSEKIISTL